MHTVDFLSQDFFQQLGQGTVELPEDALEHRALASAIHSAVHRLPAGSVLAIEGSWGRGKTDLLARIAAPTFAEEEDLRPRGLAREAVWLNPWGYGSADLLTPLVTELGRRVARRRSLDRAALQKIATTVIQAGVAFGIKGAASVVPVGGALFGAVATPTAELVAGLFEDRPDAPDLDAVAAMAARFRQLVDAALRPEERTHGARLLICIDDLDRCLPDRQVALLQAVRFLLSAGAAATFVLAIDPTLAREAVRAHYQSNNFDVERYLDKMFDLRVSLRGLDRQDLTVLVRNRMADTVVRSVAEEPLREVVERIVAVPPSDLAEGLAEACHAAQLANPRVLRRLLDRFTVLALTAPDAGLFPTEPPPSGWLIAAWLVICDREPELRRGLQRLGLARNWGNVVHTAELAQGGDVEAVRWLHQRGLPGLEAAPVFARLLPMLRASGLQDRDSAALAVLDEAMVVQGL